MVASHALPTGDLACNPGMCSDWELNRQPFGSQAGTQSTEPHQPGQVGTPYPLSIPHHHDNRPAAVLLCLHGGQSSSWDVVSAQKRQATVSIISSTTRFGQQQEPSSSGWGRAVFGAVLFRSQWQRLPWVLHAGHVARRSFKVGSCAPVSLSAKRG